MSGSVIPVIVMPRHQTRLLAASLTALALALGPAGAARAQDPAGILIDEGNRAVAAGDFATAADRFRAAYGQAKRAPILLGLGAALRRLGRDPEAAVVYERYLRHPDADPAQIPEIQRTIAAIDATVARVTIGAGDPSARVWIDGGELQGFTPGGMVRLAPGEHVIAAGHEAPSAAETVRLAAGETRSVYLQVSAPGAGPALIPVVPTPVAPGPDEPSEAPAPRRRREISALQAVAITFDIAGGLALAGGIGTGIAALVMNVDAGDHCLNRGAACEPRALVLENDARKTGQIASVMMGAGGALLATGLILGAVDRSSRHGARGQVRPRVAVAPGFVTLQVAW